MANPGIHGFSEALYAFSSASNNNGSAFAGLNANTPFYNTSLGIAFLFGRYWLAIPVLAMAGSLARKKLVPAGSGTLATHTPLFVVLLIGTVILVGALTFVPALALGPRHRHHVPLPRAVERAADARLERDLARGAAGRRVAAVGRRSAARSTAALSGMTGGEHGW